MTGTELGTATTPAENPGGRSTRYDPVWRASEKYMRVRSNNVHIPLSFAFAQMLLELRPEADADIVSLAILLHDIGWWNIDMVEIVEKGFGPGMMQSDVRFRHEAEGVRLANEILAATGWPHSVIAAVVEIIDGHDTRPTAKSLNDRLVRDADRLWRYTVTGTALGSGWFRDTPRERLDQLERELTRLETPEALEIATRELGRTRVALMVHLL